MSDSPASPTPVITVTGGAAGMAADYADLLQLAGLLGSVRRAVEAMPAAAAVPGLGTEVWTAVQADVPDPWHTLWARRLRLEAVDEALAALSSAGGVVPQALEVLQHCATALFMTVDDYRHADTGVRATVARLFASAVGGLGHALASDLRLAGTLGRSAGLLVTLHPGDAVQNLVTGDPETVDEFGRLVAPLISASQVIPDGSAEVVDLGRDTRPVMTQAPRDLGDLIGELARRNDGHHGEISVSFVRGADGRRRAIVDLTGTKSWVPWPTGDATGVTTDLRAMSGATTTYERGVFQALALAGVRPDDEIMLVGHSEGGTIAIDVARDADPRRFHITSVVTAGAPIGRIAVGLPRRVQVLALENSSDVVPHADGAANPDTHAVTTVTVDEHHDGIVASHSLDVSYEPAALAVERCDDDSVQRFLADASGFFSAGAAVGAVATTTSAERPTMTTRAFWVRRR